MTTDSANSAMNGNASHLALLGKDAMLPPRLKRPQAPPLIPPEVTAFCRRNAGALLYSLSALSIFGGLNLLIGPLLRHSDRLRDILPCIGALHGYELGLLAVALLLVLWRSEMEDTVTLVVLIALFLAGSGFLLDLVVTDNRAWSWIVGGGALALAGVKLALVRRHLLRQPWGLLLVATGAIVLWTFAMPLLLSELWRTGLGENVVRLAWQGGWWLCGAGAMVLLLQGWLTRTPEAEANTDGGTAVLLRPQMVWMFALIPLAVSGLQQRVLAYVFDLPDGLSNYLLIMALLAFGVLELRRIAGWCLQPWDYVIAALPALAAVVVAQARLMPAGQAWSGPGLVGQPLLFAVVAGSVLAAMAWHHRRLGLLAVVTVYAMVVLLTFNPACLALPVTLNWLTTGAVSFTAVFLVLCHLRQVTGIYVLQVIAGIVCLLAPAGVDVYAQSLGLTLPLLALLTVGGLSLLAYFLAYPKFPRRDAIAGSLMIAAVCFWSTAPAWPWILADAAALGVLLLGWRREIWLALPLFLPILKLMHIRFCPGWILVLLSFILLGAGFWLSLRKAPPPAGTLQI